jgi:hypothetical protein
LDPPSFLNLVAPNYGSWAQPEKPRAGAVIDDATVRTTIAAAAPESSTSHATLDGLCVHAYHKSLGEALLNTNVF